MTMPAHHLWAANTDMSISVSPLKPPHLLWIVAPRWKTAKAAGFTMQLWDQHCLRLFVIKLPYKARGDSQKWCRKDICSRDIVVGLHHCHLQLAFYSWFNSCYSWCKWQLAETIFRNESLDNKSCKLKIKGMGYALNIILHQGCF